MNLDLKKEIYRILDELPDENSCLDYKLMPYKGGEDKSELLKDICAFLNSEEAYEKDKYIIFGVQDKTHYILGIDNNPMPDDSVYQESFDLIFPRPMIETGTIKYKINENEVSIGYFYINKDNTDRVYEIKTDCYYKKDHKDYKLDKAIGMIAFGSTAWIRRGSCKKLLDEHTRRKIYENDQKKKSFSLNNNIVTYSSSKIENTNVLKTAILFGKWDENNDNDKQIISKFCGMSYKNFIDAFRELSKEEPDFKFKNGVWKILNRDKFFKKYSKDFYKEDFLNFEKIACLILGEKHPKLKLPSSDRYMYNILNKVTKYSKSIREGVSNTILLVKYLESDFTNCRMDAANLSILVIRQILNKSDWSIWASLDENLLLFAEAAPTEFMNQLESYLNRDKKEKLLTENEIGITVHNYSSSIYTSLDIIAWNPEYFINSGMLMAKMAKYDSNAIKHIVELILPWHPNTMAPFEYRFTLVNNIIEMDKNIGWKILKELMPGRTSYIVPNCKPKYINVPSDDQNVTYDEYFKEIDKYIELMIKHCRGVNERIIDLIDIIDDISSNNIEKICKYLTSPIILKKDDLSRYDLWNKLLDKINWMSNDADSGNSRNKDIELLQKTLESIKPLDSIYITSRLFQKDTFNLIKDFEKYEDGEAELNVKRQNEVSNIYNKKGMKEIERLLSIVEDKFELGCVLASMNLDLFEEKKYILNNLDKIEMIDFSKGYIYQKYNVNNVAFSITLLDGLSNEAKVNFFLMLKKDLYTFERVESLLGSYASDYWKSVDVRCIEDSYTLNYCIDRMYNVERYNKILSIYRLSVFKNNEVDYNCDIVMTCLEKITDGFSQFDITEAIKDLQLRNADQNRLFYIEWKYLSFLEYSDVRPITMEKVVSRNPEKYNEILQLIYKKHSEKTPSVKYDEKIVSNAYSFLRMWKYVPGTNDDNSFDYKKMLQWYNSMKDICKKSDRLQVALSNFGHVLFYSKSDEDGLWINKDVAKTINSNRFIRDGFENEAINSLGAVNLDSEATEYMQKVEEYKEKANQIELYGYYKFASTLRSIADHFSYSADHMKETYNDF